LVTRYKKSSFRAQFLDTANAMGATAVTRGGTELSITKGMTAMMLIGQLLRWGWLRIKTKAETDIELQW